MLNLLIRPNQENHVWVVKGSLQLFAWTVSRKNFFRRTIKRINLRINLSQMPEERAQAFTANRSGVSGIANVVGYRLIQICLLKIQLIFWQVVFMKAMNTTQLQALDHYFCLLWSNLGSVSEAKWQSLVLPSGIFDNRPTQPKFKFIWDVKKVLDFSLTLASTRIYHWNGWH